MLLRQTLCKFIHSYFDITRICIKWLWPCVTNKLHIILLCRYVMEKMDMVLCGAEGVVESGGIINKVNTVK